jgi:hypothetical protein
MELNNIAIGSLLRTLNEIEWKPARERHGMRADDSAVSVAFPIRSAGMRGDTFKDAVKFFDISEHDAHIVLCSCHGGSSMLAGEAARRVRGIRSPSLWSLYFGWFR